MQPSFAHGKICYLELPANDIEASAAFYSKVFGWHVHQREDGSTSFDDATGQVSGTWVTGRPVTREIGLLVHIMVANMDATLDAVIANGGEIVQPVGADLPEITARFRDPGGNILGLYQERSLAG